VIPKDDVHFFWEFNLPAVTPVAEPMLPVQLETTSHTIFEFANKIPQVMNETGHRNIISDYAWLKTFFDALTTA